MGDYRANHLEEKILDIEIEKNQKLAKRVYNFFLVNKQIQRSNDKAFAFIITGLNLIYKKKFKEEELRDIITDGNKDKEIDAIVISKDYVDIFDFSNEDPKSDQMITLKKSIRECVVSKPRSYKNYNIRLEKILKKIHKNSTRTIRLFVVRKSAWNSGGSEMDELKKFILGIKNGYFEYLNISSLVKKIAEPENYLDEYILPVDTNEEKINYISDDNTEALIRIPIKHILELKKKSDEAGFNLFNKNVRVFLGDNKLSKQIKEVVDSEPEMFSTYHNGLVITTQGKIQRVVGGGVSLCKPQIVNGAQTVNSLYGEYKDDLSNKNLLKAKVICKIIKADETLTEKVCETSNTQIPIKPWDLRANDYIQLKLEKIINSFSYQKCEYFYSRKGNKKMKNKITISLAEFTQWIYAIKKKDPAYAKNDKKKLFDVVSSEGKYNEIKQYVESLSVKDIQNICDISTLVKNNIKKSDDNKGLLRDANIHIISLMYIRNKKDKQKHYTELEKSIVALVKKIKQNNPNITNNKIFTKDEYIWKELIKI